MKKSIVALFVITGLAGSAVADPAADALFTQAHQKQEAARVLKMAAAQRMQEAQNDEVAAWADERDANILIARAMNILKADGNKQRAWNDRNQARMLFWAAQGKFVESRNASARAAAHRHDAAELQRAIAGVRDQAGVVAQLTGDIKRQNDAILIDDATAQRTKAEGDANLAKSSALMADANRVDPPTPAMAKMVQAPITVVITPPPAFRPSLLITIK